MESNKIDINKNNGRWFSWSWFATIVLIVFKGLGKINLTWVQVFLPAMVGSAVMFLIVIVSIIIVALSSR